jgi:quercetin dioxygenase-like cupin family protein
MTGKGRKHLAASQAVTAPSPLPNRRTTMTSEMKQTQWADPTVVASEVYKLVLENERVRVFDVRFKPGQKAEMHGHPDHVIYVLSDYTLNLMLPDGSSQEVPLKAGQAIFMGAGPHAAVNIGKTEGHALVVELK